MYVLLIVVCLFVLFLLAIVLSVILRYTNYVCPFVTDIDAKSQKGKEFAKVWLKIIQMKQGKAL
jgi:hypothetical protein